MPADTLGYVDEGAGLVVHGRECRLPTILAQQHIVGLTIAKRFSNNSRMSRKPTHHIIDTLTPDAIMSRLGVSFHMIRYARSSGVFPASWYDEIDAMCLSVGIDCPRSAFNWKNSANNISSTSALTADCQPSGNNKPEVSA